MCRNTTHHYHGGNKYATPGIYPRYVCNRYVRRERKRCCTAMRGGPRQRSRGRGASGATAFTWTLARLSRLRPPSFDLQPLRRAPLVYPQCEDASAPVTEHAVPLLQKDFSIQVGREYQSIFPGVATRYES